jgi:hypothetical protein
MTIKQPEAAQLLLKARAEFVPGANSWGMKLAEDFRAFMGTLNSGAPMLLDTANAALARSLRRWGLDRQRLGHDFTLAQLQMAAQGAAHGLGSG